MGDNRRFEVACCAVQAGNPIDKTDSKLPDRIAYFLGNCLKIRRDANWKGLTGFYRQAPLSGQPRKGAFQTARRVQFRKYPVLQGLCVG